MMAEKRDCIMKGSEVSIRLSDENLSASGMEHYFYELGTDFPLSDDDMESIIRIVAAMDKNKNRRYAFSINRSFLEYHYSAEGSEY